LGVFKFSHRNFENSYSALLDIQQAVLFSHPTIVGGRTKNDVGLLWEVPASYFRN